MGVGKWKINKKRNSPYKRDPGDKKWKKNLAKFAKKGYAPNQAKKMAEWIDKGYVVAPFHARIVMDKWGGNLKEYVNSRMAAGAAVSKGYKSFIEESGEYSPEEQSAVLGSHSTAVNEALQGGFRAVGNAAQAYGNAMQQNTQQQSQYQHQPISQMNSTQRAQRTQTSNASTPKHQSNNSTTRYVDQYGQALGHETESDSGLVTRHNASGAQIGAAIRQRGSGSVHTYNSDGSMHSSYGEEGKTRTNSDGSFTTADGKTYKDGRLIKEKKDPPYNRNSPYKQKGKKGKKGKTRITKEDVEKFPALRSAYEAQERVTKGGTLDENDIEYWDRREHRSGPTAPKQPPRRTQRSKPQSDPFYEDPFAEDAKNTTPKGYYHELPARGNRRYKTFQHGRSEGSYTGHRAESGETHYEPNFDASNYNEDRTITREDSGYFYDDEATPRTTRSGGHHDPNVEKERKWVEDWYNNPATVERWERLGGKKADLKEKLLTGLAAETRDHNPNPDAAGTYNAGSHMIRYNPTEAGYDSLAHEYSHATGIDKDQGQILEDVLGKPKAGTANQEYYARGPEMYGWIQDIRKDMGVKPGQKITKEMLERSGSQDYRQLSKRFDPEKIAKAMNTVAYEDIQKQDRSDSALARLKPSKKRRKRYQFRV